MELKDELKPVLKEIIYKLNDLLYAVENDKQFPITQDYDTLEEITTLISKVKWILNDK